uniref:Uncharacterized protein n=1 Tax=Ciona intestinalis TaxID=7719 RepID=F6ZQB7_CIOIN
NNYKAILLRCRSGAVHLTQTQELWKHREVQLPTNTRPKLATWKRSSCVQKRAKEVAFHISLLHGQVYNICDVASRVMM